MGDLLDLQAVSVIVNGLSAFACAGFMVSVTEGFGTGSPLARMKLCQRCVFLVLAIGMFYNAGYTVITDTAPRPVDLAVQIAFLAVCACSGVRHLMAMREAAKSNPLPARAGTPGAPDSSP